jgi:hypothetical protein
MPITRYRSGAATVTLTGDPEAYVRRVLDGAGGDLLRLSEARAEKVRQASRAAWYSMVTKETGLSGDIDVVTTVDTNRGTFTVGIGSTDTRTAGKAGKPLVVYVHSPGPASLIKVEVTSAEWYATPEGLRANYKPFPDDKGSGPYVWRSNPKSGSGKGLLQTLVKAPMKAEIKSLLPEIRRAVEARIRNGGR